MEEKPLITLNLIDKLMHADSPSTASSSSANNIAGNGLQLCDAATDLTVHQSWLQLTSTTNKRKAEAPLILQEEEVGTEKPAAPTNPKNLKLVEDFHDQVTGCDDDENLHDHHNDEQVFRDLSLYNIKKKLTVSDIRRSSGRLLVPKEMVRNHVLPLVDVNDFVKKLESKAGVRVTVKDSDTETEHQLTFKYLSSSKGYVFNGKWADFVDRRKLKKGDEVGLYWDSVNSKFHFSVLKVASHESQAAIEVMSTHNDSKDKIN